jgi:hypothetical protein
VSMPELIFAPGDHCYVVVLQAADDVLLCCLHPLHGL